MRALVAYASRYGATEAIARRVADTIAANGHETHARPVTEVDDLTDYDAFIAGSAVYMGHWLKDAVEFVRRHRDELARRPVWLFSSGPLENQEVSEEPGDPRHNVVPVEIAEFTQTLRPRDHRVFFGALDPSQFGFRDRLIRATPVGRKLLPEGDFRDWDQIDAWAAEIAHSLDSGETGADLDGT